MAASSSAKVDTNAMRSGARTVDGTSTGIQSVNAQVDQTMQSLFGTWQSDATVAFGQAMESFNHICQAITQRLSQLSQTINQAAQNYDQQDQENTHAVRVASNNMANGGGGSFTTDQGQIFPAARFQPAQAAIAPVPRLTGF